MLLIGCTSLVDTILYNWKSRRPFSYYIVCEKTQCNC